MGLGVPERLICSAVHHHSRSWLLSPTGVFFWLPWLFSGDPVVQALIRGLVPQVTLAMVLTGPMMVFDGLAVGASDMSHVARLNLVALLGTAVFLAWFIRHGIGMGHGLPTMWWGFAVFFSLRVLQNGAHFWHGRRSNVFSGRGTEPVPFDPAVEL